MKIARVILIHRPGAKDEFNNYGPILLHPQYKKNLRSYLMIDVKKLSVEIISYQSAILVSEMADILAWQLLI